MICPHCYYRYEIDHDTGEVILNNHSENKGAFYKITSGTMAREHTDDSGKTWIENTDMFACPDCKAVFIE
jgi:hypothetical protein